jgi:kinesin family protein 18/19
LEIYNEHIIDLLADKTDSLMIIEDNLKGVIVPDLNEFIVNNNDELIKLIVKGNLHRTMAPNNINQFSSRSHAILQIVVEQRGKLKDTKEEIIISKFIIVDLAGSEKGGLEKGIRREEGANINKSLLSLGNCINMLSDKNKKGTFVPYRDSKLTRLLKDSLGGNILTSMIACVTASPLNYDETVNTLKYATRAMNIQKKITKNVKEVNVHISQYK